MLFELIILAGGIIGILGGLLGWELPLLRGSIAGLMIIYGLACYPYPKEDRHKVSLAIGCIVFILSGFSAFDPHKDRVLAEDELAFVIQDLYPVTDGHLLVIPKRHAETYFDLVRPEINALNRLLLDQKERIEKEDDSVTGFNVGINSGESAGQTVFHCHIHLIPRRKNDVDNPRGGVRGVVPDKADYLK